MVEVSLEQPKVKWLGQAHNSDIHWYRVGFQPITINLTEQIFHNKNEIVCGKYNWLI